MKQLKPAFFYATVTGLLLIWLFTPVFPVLFGRFLEADSYYSHGFLIPFISLFLVWRKRDEVRRIPPASSVSGLFLFVSGLCLYLASLVLKFNFGTFFAFPVCLMGIVLYVGGARLARVLFFPICFLIFMLPLPKVLIIGIAFRMKVAASEGAAALIRILGIDAHRTGSRILYPGGFLLVGDPCSGLRSLISFLALGTLLTQFICAPFWKKVTVFLSTIPIALVSNMLRIAFLVLVAYVYGQETALGTVHDVSGMLVFVVGFILYLLLIRVLRCAIYTKNT